MIAALGLTTRKGRKLTKQTFARMMSNPIYAGWVVSGDIRVRGKHTALISDELFESVQERIDGKAVPHKRLNEDFPLRGSVLCASCKRPLTAGWAKGRTERYPRYWCWTKGCRAVGVSRDDLDRHFMSLLGRMEPTAELLADLPNRVATRWSERKGRIAAEAAQLAGKLAEQKTLNQMAIKARVKGEIEQEDFDTIKAEIAAETKQIEKQISDLDSENATMEQLMRQAEKEAIDLVAAWNKGNVNQRQELVKGFFPEGLVFSHKRGFFEPANTVINEMLMRWLLDQPNVGVPDGI
ncbi:recombinase family protein [Alloacidobacterium dinghuense]|uniref:Recombinase family protein n=1 Tax=Alloacidobacterium dinghuense TaxID=2763107 RepID=A0A7G8BJP6_9BACT|nr:recombinase family protein [Alloacidobacterium dinghuense]